MDNEIASDATPEKRVAHIEQKFKVLAKTLKSLENYLTKDPPDAVNAELRLKPISNLYHGYVNNREELISLKPDHPDIAAFDDLESSYFNLASQVAKLNKPPPTPCANSTMFGANNTVTFTERTDVARLAPLQVPKFDGNHKNWQTWKASFQALIHDRPGMAGSVKLSQLQSSVQGLAARVIHEFCLTPSDVNYDLAWEALCSAYDHRRVLVNEHFEALLKLAPIQNPNSETTATLMYTVRQHVSILKAMNITIGDEFVLYILERCLPGFILSRWMDRQSNNQFPKVEDLYTFIQDWVLKQRAIDNLPKSGQSYKRKGANPNTEPSSKVSKPTGKTLFTTSATDDNACVQCGQSHRLYKCEAFNNAKLNERWELVKSKGLCRNCLYVHTASCTSEKKCKKCQKNHHTLLHADKKYMGVNASKSQPTNDSKSSGPKQP